MRVTDKILQCAVFLGIERENRFVPLGTACLVNTHYANYRPAISFQYLVTCAHVVQDKESKIIARVNQRGGGTKPIQPPRGWFYHPDPKRSVDVAVAPILLDPAHFDISSIPMDSFCTQQILDERDVGVGDELFYPGMFVSHYGKTRNMPVMRLGTIAGMANDTELITSQSGALMKVHLIESRSIGGHSGSPVFVNFLAPRRYFADKKVMLPLPSESDPYRVLGILRSHLNAKDSGEYSTENTPGGKDWVNSGIATVVPSTDVIEAINQEELKRMRDKDAAEHKKSIADQPDSVSEEGSAPSATADNPSHKEAFTSLVGAAAKKRPQAD